VTFFLSFFFSYFNIHIFYIIPLCLLLYLEHLVLSRGGRRRDNHGVGSVEYDVQITKVVVSEFGDNNNVLCKAQSNIIDDMSPLCYMNVGIRCNENEARRNVSALCDTGSEMSLVRSDLLADFIMWWVVFSCAHFAEILFRLMLYVRM